MKFITKRTIGALALCLLASALVAVDGKKKIHWEDQVDPAVFEVSNTNSFGPGSLQRAIEKAGRSELPTEIKFILSTTDSGYNAETGTWTIQLEKPLEIPSNTCIDGFSQKGSSENTQGLEHPDNSVLKIEIQRKSPETIRAERLATQLAREAALKAEAEEAALKLEAEQRAAEKAVLELEAAKREAEEAAFKLEAALKAEAEQHAAEAAALELEAAKREADEAALKLEEALKVEAEFKRAAEEFALKAASQFAEENQNSTDFTSEIRSPEASFENLDEALLNIEIQPMVVSANAMNESEISPDTIIFAKGSTASRLRGLIVHGSPFVARDGQKEALYPAAIRVLGNEHVIEGCYVGVDASGENSDSTVIALAVEGNHNVIGDRRFASQKSTGKPNPASRVILGGLGVTSLDKDVPALLFTGKYNRVVNGQFGIKKSGSELLNAIASTGIQAIIPVVVSADAAKVSDLSFDTFAAAGSKRVVLNLTSFNNADFTNVSVGTNSAKTAGLGGGIGLSALNSLEKTPQGNLVITGSVFSGLSTGLVLGTKLSDVSASSVPLLNSVTVQNSFIGTNGTGTKAIPNTNGAVTRNILALTVTGNTISGNQKMGWQHGAQNVATTSAQKNVNFDSNYFGIATPPSQQPLPNTIGLSLLEPALLKGNILKFNGYGIVASKAIKINARANTNISNTKANTQLANKVEMAK